MLYLILNFFMNLNRETNHTFNLKCFYRNITEKSIKDIKAKLISIIVLSIFYFLHFYDYISINAMATVLVVYVSYITHYDLLKKIVIVVENIGYKIIYLKPVLLKAKRMCAIQQFFSFGCCLLLLILVIINV